MTITAFVYGTLKRGQCNHDRFCRHVIDIRPATIIGRLYHLPAGYPALEIPDEVILAVGTGDPLADVETQASFAAHDLVMPEATNDWDTVHGELLTFANPARDLPPLDRLEGFRPDGHGLYHRALVAVRANTGVEAAWVYHTWRGPAKANACMPGCGRRADWFLRHGLTKRDHIDACVHDLSIAPCTTIHNFLVFFARFSCG